MDNSRRLKITSKLRHTLSEMVFKFDKSSSNYVGLRNIGQYMVENSIIPCDSLEDYVNGRAMSRRKRILYLLWTILMTVNMVRFAILSLYSETWLLHHLGEFMYELYETKMMSLLYVACSFNSMPYLIFHYFLVKKSKFKTLEIFHELINNFEATRLNKINTKKMNRITFISDKIIRQQVKFIMIIIIISATYLVYLAYTDRIVDHSLIILSLNMITTCLWLFKVVQIGFVETTIFCLTNLYMRFKFKEFRSQLERSVQITKQNIQLSINNYTKISDLVKDSSLFCNYVIGTVYYNCSIMITITRTIAFDETIQLWKTLLFSYLFVVILVLCYAINLIASWLPTNNRSIAKSLYPLFCNRHKLFVKTRTLMKVDDFISMLNKKYLGFYCFNLFKFTKISFYEYFIVLTTSYFLIMKK